MYIRFIASLFFTGFVIVATAHGDLHERIVETTKEIKNHPDSSFLYLKRGQLFFQHEEYKKSLKDYLKCQSMGFPGHILQYNIANTHYRLRHFDHSLLTLERILSTVPDHVKSLRLKGLNLLEMKQYQEAGDTFKKVIHHAAITLPENYLEASEAFQNCMTAECQCDAKDVVLEGIEKIGPLFTFYARLVSLSHAQKNTDDAIYYQTKIIDQANRKEQGYYDRALLYLERQQHVEAKNDLILAKNAIAKLRNNVRSRRQTKDLERSINRQLNQLN